MKKRFLCILITSIIISSLALTGCKSSTGTDTKKPDVVGSEEYSLPFVKDGSVTLTYAGVDSWTARFSYNDNLEIWQELEKRTGVKINWQVMPPNQYNTAIQTRLAARQDLPDIMAIPPFGNNADVVRFASEDLLIPIDTYLNEKNAPNMVKLFEKHPDIKQMLTAPDGHIYSAAEILKEVNHINPRVFMIRKDWLDKLGLSVPQNADEWYKVLKAFKEKDPNGTGKDDVIPITVSWGFGDYSLFGSAFGIHGNSGFWVGKDKKVVYEFLKPEFKELLTFLNRLYKEGLMDPQYSLNDESKQYALVSKGVVGVTVHQTPVVDKFNTDLKNAGFADANMIPMIPPKSSSGETFIIKRAPLGARFGILKNTKYPDIAVKWMDYIWASEEGLRLQNFGIEGKSFRMESGKPVLTDFVLKNPEGLNAVDALRSLGAFPSLFSYQLREFREATTSESIKDFSKVAEPFMIEPYPSIMASKEESDRLNSIMIDIETYRDEMIQKFIMGAAPLSDFDKFVEQIKKMGINEAIKIRQEQYDRSSKK
jgi:putative aldouronate transport system substrate-binding protein